MFTRFQNCKVGTKKVSNTIVKKNPFTFWLIWYTSKWPYIIMIHEFIHIWDHDLGSVDICGICVHLSRWEYWSQKLHILQVYHIMLPMYAYEIFSQYDTYFSSGSHFAQIIKVAILSTSLPLGGSIFGLVMNSIWGYLLQRNCVSGLHSLKVMNFKKNLHFEICIFHEICRISHEIHCISWCQMS